MAEETETALLVGRELRELRMFRGMSARDVDASLGWRPNKSTELEHGVGRIRWEDLKAYVGLFGYSLDEFDRLLEERRAYETTELRARVATGVTGGKTSFLQRPIDLQGFMGTPLSPRNFPVGAVS